MSMTHSEPTEIELRDWRSLRSLPSPGPGTLRIVYNIAFPVLLDAYDRLTANVTALRAAIAERDARIRELEEALNEARTTHDSQCTGGSPCNCGADEHSAHIDASLSRKGTP